MNAVNIQDNIYNEKTGISYTLNNKMLVIFMLTGFILSIEEQRNKRHMGRW